MRTHKLTSRPLRFEHTYDPDTEAERFVLTVDLVALALVPLLLLLARGIVRRARRR